MFTIHVESAKFLYDDVLLYDDVFQRILHNLKNKRYVTPSLQYYDGERVLGPQGVLLSAVSPSWRHKKIVLKRFLNPG